MQCGRGSDAISVNTVPLASRVYVVGGVVPQTDGGDDTGAKAEARSNVSKVHCSQPSLDITPAPLVS